MLSVRFWKRATEMRRWMRILHWNHSATSTMGLRSGLPRLIRSGYALLKNTVPATIGWTTTLNSKVRHFRLRPAP